MKSSIVRINYDDSLEEVMRKVTNALEDIGIVCVETAPESEEGVWCDYEFTLEE